MTKLVNLSFSLLFHDPDAEPLDLVAETEQEYFAWTMGLAHLISTFALSLNKMKQGAVMTKACPPSLLFFPLLSSFPLFPPTDYIAHIVSFSRHDPRSSTSGLTSSLMTAPSFAGNPPRRANLATSLLRTSSSSDSASKPPPFTKFVAVPFFPRFSHPKPRLLFH